MQALSMCISIRLGRLGIVKSVKLRGASMGVRLVGGIKQMYSITLEGRWGGYEMSPYSQLTMPIKI